MKIDESVLRDDVRFISQQAANYDARVCDETSKDFLEAAAFNRGMAAGLRAAASVVESRIRMESARDPDQAQAGDPLANALG